MEDCNDESEEKENLFRNNSEGRARKVQEKKRDGVIDSCQTSENHVLDVFAKRSSWACRQMDVQKGREESNDPTLMLKKT